MNREPAFHIVLHQPEIPQNTGNIGRTCVALDAKLWLVKPLGFTIDERHVRRAALDYWQHLDWEAVDDWSELLERLGTRRLWLLTKTAERLYTDVAFAAGDALVFGSETQGLPAELRSQYPGATLRIPMNERVRSLNLSNAVAIVGYEAHRQIALGPQAGMEATN